MRVVCPHLGEPHPETRAVVDRWPGAVYVDLSDDPDYGYGKLLRELWASGESFAIVEHDVVPWLHTIPEFAFCPEPYCAAPYPLEAYVGVALGCTKFSGLLTRCFPDAAEIACRIPSPFGEPGHYRQLDVWLQGAVLRDLYGLEPHCHLPAVEHRNPARELCEAARGLPVRTTVAWGQRLYLEPGLVESIGAEVAGRAGVTSPMSGVTRVHQSPPE